MVQSYTTTRSHGYVTIYIRDASSRTKNMARVSWFWRMESLLWAIGSRAKSMGILYSFRRSGEKYTLITIGVSFKDSLLFNIKIISRFCSSTKMSEVQSPGAMTNSNNCGLRLPTREMENCRKFIRFRRQRILACLHGLKTQSWSNCTMR